MIKLSHPRSHCVKTSHVRNYTSFQPISGADATILQADVQATACLVVFVGKQLFVHLLVEEDETIVNNCALDSTACHMSASECYTTGNLSQPHRCKYSAHGLNNINV